SWWPTCAAQLPRRSGSGSPAWRWGFIPSPGATDSLPCGGDFPERIFRPYSPARGFRRRCTGARGTGWSARGAMPMRTVDRIEVNAPVEKVFEVAADVERWPDFLAHYRWVRVKGRDPSGCTVEMAAWRPFGLLRYPTRWVSRMEIDRSGHRVRYRHIEGITRGMDVEWNLRDQGKAVEVTIVHEWNGPA